MSASVEREYAAQNPFDVERGREDRAEIGVIGSSVQRVGVRPIIRCIVKHAVDMVAEPHVVVDVHEPGRVLLDAGRNHDLYRHLSGDGQGKCE
jgi:hypothetical protein